MMKRLRYVNSENETITFNEGSYFMSPRPLFAHQWSYTAANLPNAYGNSVRNFTRNVATKQLAIGIGRAGGFVANMNRLHRITETDILAETPGRLYLNDQYIVGYLSVDSSVEVYSRRVGFAEKQVAFLAADPAWITEVKQEFYPSTNEIMLDGKRYPNRYPYRFAAGYATQEAHNNHYADTPFQLTVFGPAANPNVTLAGNQYGAEISLNAGERFVLNQMRRTIVSIDSIGRVTNQFNNRLKVDDPFKPLPPGPILIQFNGYYGFEIIMYQRRSEPIWRE